MIDHHLQLNHCLIILFTPFFHLKFKIVSKNVFQKCVFCRSSFDCSVPHSKKKAQTEGEDTEEDVEEQKVSVLALQTGTVQRTDSLCKSQLERNHG